MVVHRCRPRRVDPVPLITESSALDRTHCVANTLFLLLCLCLRECVAFSCVCSFSPPGLHLFVRMAHTPATSCIMFPGSGLKLAALHGSQPSNSCQMSWLMVRSTHSNPSLGFLACLFFPSFTSFLHTLPPYPAYTNCIQLLSTHAE